MSDTPLTDAEWDRLLRLPGGGYSANPNTTGLAVEMAGFAKKLERELAKLEANYQRIVATVLRCDPVPACKRGEDSQEHETMKLYNVCIPLTGTIWVTVEAESKEAAIDAALESGDITTENIHEWETHRQICRGNVLSASVNEAYAEEDTSFIDDDLDEPLPPKQCGLDDPECESCQ